MTATASRRVVNMRKAIEPVGESKSDYEAVCAVAEKLGMLDEVTDGFTEAELIKGVFDGMRLRQDRQLGGVRGEGLLRRPVRDGLAEAHGRLVRLLQGPREATPSPRPPASWSSTPRAWTRPSPTTRNARGIPKWIEKGITHDERMSSKRARPTRCWSCPTTGGGESTPSATTSPGPRKRSPARSGASTAIWYEPCWMHPSDAEAERGIKNGDIVSVYNERGSVLCGALVFERIMPGVLSIDHGARADYIIPEQGRPRWRHQHHRARGSDLQARRRPGHQRLPGRGGAGEHGADG